MEAEPANQWLKEHMMPALDRAVELETARRSAVNIQLAPGIKLSIRNEAVRRDILRGWLDAAAQAGNA